MRCFVTGAAGFIGGALTQRLAAHGHQVTGLLHTTPASFTHPNVNYITGDITDADVLASTLHDYDVVFHCAAYVKDYGRAAQFQAVNVKGTQLLADACSTAGVKRFVFLSHLKYESNTHQGHYQITKDLAEHYLLQKHQQHQFPVVIICPGNVIGPGATTWVLRPLTAIQRNRIALIDHGSGIFLHTYIDNLIDALLAAAQQPAAIGETIEITDGDNTTTWKDYLNTLAHLAGKPPIHRDLSKNTALLLGKTMMVLHRLFHIEPWVTPTAVEIFTNTTTVSLTKAQDILGYTPKISYPEGLSRIHHWLKTNEYLTYKGSGRL